MICKECGAYNPDHATFCKVCAASLKEDAAPKPIEEEPQPTKRFSRPSWMAAEQSEPVHAPVKETADPVDEAEDAKEVVEEIVEPAKAAPVQEEETPVPIWSPSRSRMRPEPNDIDDEEEKEESSETEESEDEPESIYNDEEALDDEDDAFEYEPTPPKRKQSKKKDNTMFTVLLIAIIVVIVGILVFGGYWLLKGQLNCGKSPDRTPEAEQTSTQPSEQDNTPAEPATTEAPALDAKTAQLQEMIDEKGNDVIAITVVIPANSTVTINFPNQPDYTFTNSEAKDLTRKVKIPVEVFYPNTPLEDPTVVFQPEITITGSDGSSYQVNCPTFTRTFPKLEITVTEPIPEGDEPFMAPESNIVSLQGVVSDPTAEVSINGVGTVVYVGGKFMYDYKFADTATEDTVDTITITATKNNCVGDTKEVQVHAYKFIPEPMKLEVRSEGSALRADKSGKLTVTGTTLPGATLTATSDNATNVLCGSVAVDAEGNFSFQITTEESFYGMSAITLNAEKEGAESGSVKFTVTKGFADKEAFLKYYNSRHSYLEIPSKITLDVLLANQTQYASNDYGFRITATVVEVITIDGDTIVKMSMNKTNETVYVHNLSDKWTPGENVGAKYNVYGNFVGSYSDTGCCEFYGWFAKKA
jgi:flagellar basal body-associated protein FliL